MCTHKKLKVLFQLPVYQQSKGHQHGPTILKSFRLSPLNQKLFKEARAVLLNVQCRIILLPGSKGGEPKPLIDIFMYLSFPECQGFLQICGKESHKYINNCYRIFNILKIANFEWFHMLCPILSTLNVNNSSNELFG